MMKQVKFIGDFELEIDVPDGMKLCEESLKNRKVVFLDKDPMEDLPESWEEIKSEDMVGFCLDECANIENINGMFANADAPDYRTTLPTKELCEGLRAYCQLIMLCHRYNDNGEARGQYVYVIHSSIGNIAGISECISTKKVLSFKSRELAVHFLSRPKIVQLIEIAVGFV